MHVTVNQNVEGVWRSMQAPVRMTHAVLTDSRQTDEGTGLAKLYMATRRTRKVVRPLAVRTQQQALQALYRQGLAHCFPVGNAA